MTPLELKNSILQLAIQGKLVEQRPEEGTAEELYRRIQKEKQRLFKAGKIKKEKPLPEIVEDEKPFDIPESWKWVRLSQIAESSLGKTLDKMRNTGELKPYLCSINVYWNGINLETVKEARFEEFELAKYLLKRGDLLICEGGDVGRSAVWENDGPMYYQNALHRVRFYCDVSPYFYKFLIECYKGIGIIDSFSKGVTIKHLVQNSLNAIWLPLPPLTEQKRIVAKIEELLPYNDRYEQAWSRLENFNKRFPDDMKKSILQLAIRGKLVEQRPEEGTAEELYQLIQEEKQQLIKAGNIKKEKPLPKIAKDEIPFAIPDTWKWVRLKDLTEAISDGIHGTPEFQINGGYFFINGNNLCDGKIVFREGTQQVSNSEYEKYKNPLSLSTILISINGTIGNIAYYNNERVILGKSACYITLLSGVYRNYIRTLLESKFFFDYAFREATQTTIKNVSLKAIRMFPIPLPPLAEQKRIVEKLEELLPLCERLK